MVATSVGKSRLTMRSESVAGKLMWFGEFLNTLLQLLMGVNAILIGRIFGTRILIDLY